MTKYLLIILLLFGCSKKTFQTVTNHQDFKQGEITERQAEIIFKHCKLFPNNTQLSIAIIENGKVNFYGVKRENDTIKNIDNSDKFFSIASITKVFTSTLLANLVLEKKLKLDDPVNDYLDIPFNDNQTITFKELANHTSGLPRLATNMEVVDWDNPYKDYDEKKLKEYISNEMLLGKKKYSYSNIGAAILGYTFTKIEGKSFEELLENKIFSTYRMLNSTTIRKNIESKLVLGLNKNGVITPNWDKAAHIGSGGIYSTTEDLTKFALAQFDTTNTELELTRLKTVRANLFGRVGLGWNIIKRNKGNTYYTHDGGTGGYTSMIRIDVKNQNGVIILSNVSAFNENRYQLVLLRNKILRTLKEK